MFNFFICFVLCFQGDWVWLKKIPVGKTTPANQNTQNLFSQVLQTTKELELEKKQVKKHTHSFSLQMPMEHTDPCSQFIFGLTALKG